MVKGMPNRKVQLADVRKRGWPMRNESGEVVIRVPDGKFLRLNNRRKEGTRALKKALEKW